MSPSPVSRCQHTGCACAAPPGELYCSDYCQAAASAGTGHTPGATCGCGHAGCTSHQPANGAR